MFRRDNPISHLLAIFSGDIDFEQSVMFRQDKDPI